MQCCIYVNLTTTKLVLKNFSAWFMENKTEIMEHVLKTEKTSLLPTYIYIYIDKMTL